MIEHPRLSRQEFIVLHVLATRNRPMYAAEIVSASENQLKRGGGIYVTLSRMIDKDFLTSKLSESGFRTAGPPRPLYSPTDEGSKAYEATCEMLRRNQEESGASEFDLGLLAPA